MINSARLGFEKRHHSLVLALRSGDCRDAANIAAIVAAWSFFLVVLLVLQRAGAEVGFAVWPMGEDRNWISILQSGPGSQAASVFWGVNDRNPLSPWWYIAFRGFILNVEPGLLFLKFLTSLLLGIACYALCIALNPSGERSFALGIGLAVALFMPNGYLDQIYWNFEGALVFSIASVVLYLKSGSGDRRDHWLYGLSLVAWFVALASYTIQCGAILAIAYLAFTRAKPASNSLTMRLIMRARCTAADVLPYALLFVLFIAVWRTAARTPEAYELTPQAGNFLQSLRMGVWHFDLSHWVRRVIHGEYTMALLAASAAVAIICVVLLRLMSSRHDEHTSSPQSVRHILDVLVVVALLALPTVLVETSGSHWLPGWRWRMIYHVTTPIFYLSLVMVVALLVTRNASLRRWIWASAVAIVIGFGVLSTLILNRMQVDVTRHEKMLNEALFDMAARHLWSGGRLPLQFLVKRDREFSWYSSDLLSHIYAETWYRRKDISFRFVPTSALGTPSFEKYWPVRFGSDSEGVGNAKIWGITMPYDNVMVVEADGGGIRRVSTLNAADMSGFNTEWNRVTPIHFAPLEWAPCPTAWSADADALLDGWSFAESDASGPFRWTVSRSASIAVPTSCDEAARLRITAAFAVSEPNLNGLRASVGGVRVALRRSSDGLAFEGLIPRGALVKGRTTTITIQVPQLDRVPGGNRHFGVAIRRLTIEPILSGT
jgi:hypothetical protein